MVSSSAERQRLYRVRQKQTGQYEQLKNKHAERMKPSRIVNTEMETNLSVYKQRKLIECRREKVCKRVTKHRMLKTMNTDSSNKKTPFKSAMAYAKATSRVKRALPETPRRRKIICKKLYEMCEESSSYTPPDSQSHPRYSALNSETVKLD